MIGAVMEAMQCGTIATAISVKGLIDDFQD
jgi:hypothetical protein